MDDLPSMPPTETLTERLTKRRGIRDVWFWVFLALVLLMGVEVWFLTRAFYISSVITSNSMEPTLKKGDRVLVRRYRFSPSFLPPRGAIVMLKDPRDPNNWLIKRVIGLPKEVVTVAFGQVFINGQPLTELYLHQPTDSYWHGVVPEGCVFVMGDNRSVSDDSRDFGPVPLENLEGKVVLRYYPLNRFCTFP